MHRRHQLTRASRRWMLASVIAATPTLPSLAQDAPATAPAAQGETLIAKITAVKGVAQVRTAEDQPWKPATVGMEVDEGAELRTGPRSAVQFVIPPDQTVTLDRLGTIKVLQAVKDAGKVTTALGMKYGRTRLDVQAADLEHDSTIRSPGSTLAIRGTDVTFEDMAPFPPNAISRTGRATFVNSKRKTVAFGGKVRANVSAERASPAETALVRTRTDPQSGFSGRSETEKNLVTQLPSLGGGDLSRTGPPGFREQARLDTRPEGVIPPGPPMPGPGPAPKPPGPGPMMGELQFELKWTGAPFMDLDLEVANGMEQAIGGPIDATALPPPGPGGSQHLGNKEADSAGNGRETVIWSPSFPADFYLVRVIARNSGIVDARVRVVQDPNGANILIRDTGTLPLVATNPFFQQHVAVPPTLPGPPPPLPNPPPFPAFFPPPQPGPDPREPSAGATAPLKPAKPVRPRGPVR